MMKQIPHYEPIQEVTLKDLDSEGYLLRHKETGAKVVLIKNQDDNKVFTIGFRTPPINSTGVPHIVEHTVLCGSDKYPAKDPFVELAKGSLNTFLNAMTYSDKTVYPIASCNDKDFQNLMDVYLDAVFHPNIYKEEKIFRQEGWHYEMEDADAPLTYNGVVYNEMKGVFSSPEQQLERAIQKSLFPHTAYGVESGGEPEHIPELSYEEFLDFHKKYYHPSNSYIYLYGDMDMEEKLTYIHDEYLSQYDKLDVDSELADEAAFEKMQVFEDVYALSEGESTEKKAYFSYNAVVGDSLDRELYVAFQVLEYVLVDTPGAILKKALIDAGIGEDVMSSYDNGIKQPVFSIMAKNADGSQKEDFLKVILDSLKKVVKEGIDEKALLAALNYFEFKYREADFAHYPKGLMYGLQIFDSWLYDENKPFIHIQANDTFAALKKRIGTGYFEELVEKYLIQNTHISMVVLLPKPGLTIELENAENQRLAEYKATLSSQEIDQIVKNTKELKEYQSEPSPKEILEMIPLLSIDDIDKKAKPMIIEETTMHGVKALTHDVFTNGISYFRLAYKVTDLKEYAPYLSLLVSLIGYVDTESHSYSELSNEIDLHTGGITNSVFVCEPQGSKDFEIYLDFQVRVLTENLQKAVELIEEMVSETKYGDEKRLREVLAEGSSRLQMKFASAGHTTAVARCDSYGSEAGFCDDSMKGIGLLEFITDLLEHFDERKEETINILDALTKKIFVKDRLLIDVTGDKDGICETEKALGSFLDRETEDAVEIPQAPYHAKQNRNEGFFNAGKVQFVARTGNFVSKGFKYTGALKVVRTILSYDYLWNQIRVKGGAYGAMCGFAYSGRGYMTSYRDPNLEKTLDVYGAVPTYLENFKVDDRDMTKFIIGAISDMDVPLTPKAKGARAFSAYIRGISDQDLQRERDEVLSADVAAIRETAKIVRAILDCDYICAIGGEEKIKEASKLFQEIKPLS